MHNDLSVDRSHGGRTANDNKDKTLSNDVDCDTRYGKTRKIHAVCIMNKRDSRSKVV